MKEVMEKCVPGAQIHEICVFGNKRINDLCKEVYTNKKIEKGVCYPVSIAVDNICGHFSPIKEESF